MNPSFAAPARTMTPPTISASTEAIATALTGSPSAIKSGASVAAIMGPREESGPSTRILLGPNIA